MVTQQDIINAQQARLQAAVGPMENYYVDGKLDFKAYDDAIKKQIAGSVMANGRELQDASDPWVQVSGSGQGVPGVSLRQSDYDREYAAYTSQFPGQAVDPSTFAASLRSKYGGRGGAIGESPGLQYTNQQAVEMSGRFIDQQNAAERKARLGTALKIGAGALAAFAAPAVLGSLGVGGAGAAAQTGISAGGSALGGGASSFGGLGSALGNFSTKAALSGALKGGIGGLVSGDGLSGALKGAALGSVTGGYAPAISGAIGGPLGTAVAGGLQGAAGGLASGNLKTAGIGAALGGAGGYFEGGGSVPGLGTLAGSPLTDAQGPTQGSGILGNVSRAASTAKNTLSSLTGGGSSSGGTNMLGNALKIGGSIYEDKTTRQNNDRIAQALQAAQGQAQSYLSPYVQAGSDATSQLSAALKAGFQPGDLTQDPGYQFRLKEGEQALQRRMAASGLGQSGAALKAAQEYGQGLADQTYNDAYQRWLSGNSQLQNAAGLGQNSATNSAQLSASMGDAQAAILAANQESKNKRLSGILGGIGAFF